MTISPRWRKLLGDLNSAQGRILLMALSLMMGIFALTAIFGSYNILAREMSKNYLATAPASAVFDVGTVTPEILSTIKADPDVDRAEPVSVLKGRARLGNGDWHRLLLFVVPDFSAQTIGTVKLQDGAFPPPDGTLALERKALAFIRGALNAPLEIEFPNGKSATMAISASVHDASLAPAGQEGAVYAYATSATVAQLGGPAELELVRVVVRGAEHDQTRVDKVAARIALQLKDNGTPVHQIQIPPVGEHPHQNQMNSVLTMFMLFGALALLLSGVLTASMVEALLAQQVRQIAIMKAVGATSMQITTLYLVGVAVISGVATAIGVPLGIMAAGGFSGTAGDLLNFDITSAAVPAHVVALLCLVGMAVPLLLVWFPVREATSVTVRDALADYGVTRDDALIGWIGRLMSRVSNVDRSLVLSVGNAFRRRKRLVLNLTLLGVAGAMFLAAMNVESAWQGQVRTASAARDFNLEVRLNRPVDEQRLLGAISSLPSIASVKPADSLSGAIGRQDGLVIVRSYADGGHGSLTVQTRQAISANERLIEGSLGDDSGSVVNQIGWTLVGRPPIGSGLRISVEGRTVTTKLTGVIKQEITPASIFLPRTTFDNLAQRPGQVSALQIKTRDNSIPAVEAAGKDVEGALAMVGAGIENMTTSRELASALAGHVQILVVALLSMASIMAAVGAMGLASAQSTNVTERTREFGVMRAMGASSLVLIRNILAEGLINGVLSLPIAVLVGIPLGYGVGALVGNLSFGMALPLSLSHHALGIWVVVVIASSLMASFVPAVRSTRLSIRETLAHA